MAAVVRVTFLESDTVPRKFRGTLSLWREGRGGTAAHCRFRGTDGTGRQHRRQTAGAAPTAGATARRQAKRASVARLARRTV
ncbi:hypothetical protein, partial [Curtobacterium pusillum]|uniref:hypothetical protein n=1 Tax=Curtobacterium pusillum TaxID=69373 RepID=UPI001C306435